MGKELSWQNDRYNPKKRMCDGGAGYLWLSMRYKSRKNERSNGWIRNFGI